MSGTTAPNRAGATGHQQDNWILTASVSREPAALFAGRLLVAQTFEWLGFEFSTLPGEDLDFSFSRLQFLPAGIREANSFFKKLQRLLQRKVAAFQLLDDLFQLLQAIFEFSQLRSPEPG